MNVDYEYTGEETVINECCLRVYRRKTRINWGGCSAKRSRKSGSERYGTQEKMIRKRGRL